MEFPTKSIFNDRFNLKTEGSYNKTNQQHFNDAIFRPYQKQHLPTFDVYIHTNMYKHIQIFFLYYFVIGDGFEGLKYHIDMLV